ncbi:hypothetical protein ACYZX9_11350 [Sphingomonas citri]
MGDDHLIRQTAAILAAIKTIRAETDRMAVTFSDLAGQVQRRKAAVRELARLTDVAVDLTPSSMSIVAQEDVVLLAIYKAGPDGATTNDLRRVWIEKIGRERAATDLAVVLASLVEQNAIADRGGSWIVPAVPVARRSAGISKSIRDRIIHILETQSGGIKAQQITEELSRLLGTAVPITTVSPVMSQLKRAGKVIHEGVYWRLATVAENDVN